MTLSRDDLNAHWRSVPLAIKGALAYNNKKGAASVLLDERNVN